MTPHRFTAAVVLTKYNGCTVSTQAEAVGFKVHGWAKNAAKTKAEAMKQERRQLHWTSYRGGQCGALPTPVASRSSIKASECYPKTGLESSVVSDSKRFRSTKNRSICGTEEATIDKDPRKE